MSERPCRPCVVKPRKHGYTHLPIIAVDRGDALNEHGQVWTFREFVNRLPGMPPHIIVCSDSAHLLSILDGEFSATPNWQFRITPIKQHVMKSNGAITKWQNGRTMVNFFGWQRQTGRSGSRFHYPIDPGLFSRTPLPDVKGIGELLEWGKDVRDWCGTQDLRITPTAGGIAAQLLRDKRWFPDARRKVPRATNTKIRPRLPGNYYKLYAEVDTPYTAYYLDMRSAHHSIAREVQFPHPDTLMARGRFRIDGEEVGTPDNRAWLRSGTPGFNRALGAHGLIYARLMVPALRAHRFPLPYMLHQGPRMAWIFTNEIPTILELGGRIEYITAAWTSFDTDPGLNRYATFAIDQLAQSTAARKRWLKATLLSPYGILAARPREMETAFKRAEGGKPRSYPAGSTMLPARAIERPARESGITNVLYRGLIEAEQRVRTLQMARSLHTHGIRILGIYADSLFAEVGNGALPLLPPPWRVERVLEGLFFSSATHFTSRQLTKLPGVRRDATERVQLIAAMRGELNGTGYAPFTKPCATMDSSQPSNPQRG